MADDSALHRWRKALLADGVHEAVHDLPSTARLVGAGLSMYVNPETMKAWPSAASVAVRTGLSERAVRRGFETLEAAGWLVAEVRGGVPGGRRTTLWMLTTPEPLTGVTPERESEVVAVTPDSQSTTSEPQSTTPDRESDEQGELDTEQGERGVVALARSLVRQHPEEADERIERASAKWGRGIVAELVARYAEGGVTFVYASDLNRRIDLDAPAPVRPAPAYRPRCGVCGNSGWLMPLGASTAERCECNPDPMMASKAVTS